MTRKARKHIPMKVKCASALLALRDMNANLLIPYEHGKLMSADQILSLFQWHHWPVPHSEEGADVPSNITPLLIKEHAEQTKIDIPRIAKNKRVRRKEQEHRDRLIEERAPLWWTVGYRKKAKPSPRIKSRGFDKSATRTFSGKVKPRKARRK